MRYGRLVAGILLAGLPLAGSALAEELDGAAIRSLIAGKKVYLSTPYGVELPLEYKRNGAVRGDVSGISLARVFTPSETGQWWVDGNRLCQKWPSWYDGTTACFSLRKTADGIRWLRDDGLKGTASIE